MFKKVSRKKKLLINICSKFQDFVSKTFFNMTLFNMTLFYILFVAMGYVMQPFLEQFDMAMIRNIFSFMFFILYVTRVFELIAEVAVDKTSYTKGILSIFGIALLAIVFFAANYLFVFIDDSMSFAGNVGDNLVTQIISFSYFSIITFSTIGFGDITPISNLARIYVMGECLFSLIMILLVFSAFTGFHESFKNSSPFSVTRKYKKKEK